MKNLKDYINESINNSILDKDTIAEIHELKTLLNVDELKNVFKVLNYKEKSKEAKELISQLPEIVINLLKKYEYASTPQKYYRGLRALYSRTKIENYVAKKLNSLEEINNVKQVSHKIDRNDNYDFISSIGNIDVKTHFYGNKDFSISKTDNNDKADWYCFVDADLSDVRKSQEALDKCTIYLVNKNKLFDNINKQSIVNTELTDEGSYYLIYLKTIQKYAEYTIK